MRSLESDFLEALIPGHHRVAGRDLRPFSLGHAMILRRFDSPFLAGKRPGSGDLAFALDICSRTFADGVAALHDRRSKRRWRWLGYRCMINREAKMLQFIAYLNAGMRYPKCWENSSGSPKKTPMLQITRIINMGNLGKTESQTMDSPYHLAMWDAVTWLELTDKVDPMDEADQEFVARVKRLRAEHAARKETNA